MTEIKIEKGIKYLSEKLDDLPKNCVFDKGKTACGGTSLVLENNIPYVICVPLLSIIETKKEVQELLYITSQTDEIDIEDYLDRVSVPKFIVTYNTLWKVKELLDITKYDLLVDEAHILQTNYHYRHEAINTVLKIYKEFNRFTFLTATVPNNNFIIKEMETLPIVSCKWEEKEVNTVNIIECKENTIINTVLSICYQHIDRKIEGDAYFFCNSLTIMCSLSKWLPSKNTRYIFSENREGVELELSTVKDTPLKLNFFTSKAYEGCDLYNSKGKIYIVTDGYKKNTMLDLHTSVKQINGRIRNTEYKNNITHIFTPFKEDISQRNKTLITIDKYNKKISKLNLKYIKLLDNNDITSRKEKNKISKKIDSLNYEVIVLEKEIEHNKYNDDYNNPINYEKAISKLDTHKDECEKYLSELKKATEENNMIVCNSLLQSMENYKYVRLNVLTGKYFIDENLLNIDKYNEYLYYKVYSSKDNLKRHYKDIEYNVISEDISNIKNTEKEELSDCTVKNYTVLENYRKENDIVNYRLYLEDMNKQNNNVMKIHQATGIEDILYLFKEDIGDKIKEKFNSKINIAIPSKNVKQVLTKLYQDYNINKTAKATDLREYYNIEEKSKRIDGITTKVIIIKNIN